MLIASTVSERLVQIAHTHAEDMCVIEFQFNQKRKKKEEFFYFFVMPPKNLLTLFIRQLLCLNH